MYGYDRGRKSRIVIEREREHQSLSEMTAGTPPSGPFRRMGYGIRIQLAVTLTQATPLTDCRLASTSSLRIDSSLRLRSCSASSASGRSDACDGGANCRRMRWNADLLVMPTWRVGSRPEPAVRETVSETLYAEVPLMEVMPSPMRTMIIEKTRPTIGDIC